MIEHMIKYNSQCLEIYEADLIGKPNKVNGLLTIGTIADSSAPTQVIFAPLNSRKGEKRILAPSDGTGLVIATISASDMLWFEQGDKYLVMIEKPVDKTLYQFSTSLTPIGNAAQLTIGNYCETGDIVLNTRETPECTNC